MPEPYPQLLNLGPKSRQMLARAGITTLAQLLDVGSVAAYARAKQAGANVSLNLLWALEGAMTGTPWQTVAREHRTSLLLALEDYQRRAKAPTGGSVALRSRTEIANHSKAK
jgi:DNA transformation protein